MLEEVETNKIGPAKKFRETFCRGRFEIWLITRHVRCIGHPLLPEWFP
jgi:hypothetical protein